MNRATLELVLKNLNPGRRRAWHGGPTPAGALRGVTAAEAHWVPAPRRSSIWKLTLHTAYWNYAVRRHLVAEAVPRFPRSPANFPAVPRRPDEAAWKADRALLVTEQRLLVEAIAAFDPARLDEVPVAGKTWTFGEMIMGVAMHDAYHTGQVQLLRRLWATRRR